MLVVGVIAVVAELIRAIRSIAERWQFSGIIENVIFIAVRHAIGHRGARRRFASSILISVTSATAAATTATAPSPRFRRPIAEGIAQRRQSQVLPPSSFLDGIQFFFREWLIVVLRIDVMDQLRFHRFVVVIRGATFHRSSYPTSVRLVSLVSSATWSCRFGSTSASAAPSASAFPLAARLSRIVGTRFATGIRWLFRFGIAAGKSIELDLGFLDHFKLVGIGRQGSKQQGLVADRRRR